MGHGSSISSEPPPTGTRSSRLLPDAEPLPPPRLGVPTQACRPFIWIGSSYARYHNDRLEVRDGPIFRGRFHALCVDTDDYLACAGRYIHRNPLDFRPDEPLDQYRWSSYRYFVTPATPPKWLSTSELIEPIGGRARYRSFVEVETGRGLLEWAIDTTDP